MAAHHYRALLMELCSISNPEGDLERQAELLQHGIDYAPAFAHLDLDAYGEILNWCKWVAEQAAEDFEFIKPYQLRDDFFKIMMVHLPAIGQEWLDLGQPKCAEDWGRAKFPSLEGEDG